MPTEVFAFDEAFYALHVKPRLNKFAWCFHKIKSALMIDFDKLEVLSAKNHLAISLDYNSQ